MSIELYVQCHLSGRMGVGQYPDGVCVVQDIGHLSKPKIDQLAIAANLDLCYTVTTVSDMG